MAENKGKTKGAMMAAIVSAQTAVGSALNGATAAVAGGGGAGGSPQMIGILEDLRDIGKENERNTQSVFSILKSMFVFDKDAARRLRDQMAKDKGKKAPEPTVVENIREGKEKLGLGGLLAGGAGLVALAAFMKSINTADILRLPQQVKSIKGIASFVKGITKIGTLGLGAKFLDQITDSLKIFKTNFIARVDDLKLLAKNKFAAIKFPAFTGLAKYIDDLDFVKYLKNSKGYAVAVASLKGISSGIGNVVNPMVKAFQSVFGGGAGAGPAGGAGGKMGGAISKIITPLKAIGRTIGKLFWPITAVLAIFDGYTGFMEEYEKEKSFVDGIRGAVQGIVDGFIGGLVRLVTNAIGWMLEKLGFKHMATVITQFGEDVTACFKLAVGGLVDFVTGIFTLDLGRITKGLKNLVGGTANFLFTTVTKPVDLAIGFVQDMFGWGDPNNPFTIKGFLFGDSKTGEKGIVNDAVDWFKGLFSIDGIKEKFTKLKEKVFDMGKMFKAITLAGAAAVKAGWPGGETPSEAYKRVFDSIMNEGNAEDVKSTEGEDIVKTTATDIDGNTTEVIHKSSVINEGSTTLPGTSTVVYQDNSQKGGNTSISKNEAYVGSLGTETDTSYRSAFSNTSLALKRSDIRLKEDIKLEGKSPSGINIYSFKYKGEKGRYTGVMAQELNPWMAFFNIPGYLSVDYSKLDVDFKVA